MFTALNGIRIVLKVCHLIGCKAKFGVSVILPHDIKTKEMTCRQTEHKPASLQLKITLILNRMRMSLDFIISFVERCV